MGKVTMEKLKESMKLPIIMAPMFLINNPEMVINACKSGIIGTFPALNARTGSVLAEWMEQINGELGKFKKGNPEEKVSPWGINYITHHSNKRYVEDLELIEKYQPPIVITSLGDPSRVAKIVHEYGGFVFSDVINIKFAKRALEKGADGLILVSSGAGGHAGTYNPIAFLHEVREFFQGPVVLAGGMSKGKDILATEVLGADFAYMGSRFIVAAESQAKDEYKNMIIDSSIDDVIYTDAFSGVNANYLIPSIVNSGLDPEKLVGKGKVDFSGLGNPDVRAWKDVWGVGQGVGPINKIQTVSEIVDELELGYKAAKERILQSEKERILNK